MRFLSFWSSRKVVVDKRKEIVKSCKSQGNDLEHMKHDMHDMSQDALDAQMRCPPLPPLIGRFASAPPLPTVIPASDVFASDHAPICRGHPRPKREGGYVIDNGRGNEGCASISNSVISKQISWLCYQLIMEFVAQRQPRRRRSTLGSDHKRWMRWGCQRS